MIKSHPFVHTSVTFLTPEEGGRQLRVSDSPLYRPRLVIGDTQQRAALVDERGHDTEIHLDVRFTGNGSTLMPGVAHPVRLELIGADESDYSRLVLGSDFTIREGVHIVGYGTVVATPPSPSH